MQLVEDWFGRENQRRTRDNKEKLQANSRSFESECFSCSLKKDGTFIFLSETRTFLAHQRRTTYIKKIVKNDSPTVFLEK